VYRKLIAQGSDSLENMIELAQESEHPRAYEVLSNMIKTLGDVTDKLMDLQKNRSDLAGGGKKKEGETHPELPAGGGQVFLGTTNELQKMLVDAANAKRSEKVVNSKEDGDE
jgi:hypothetical protein